MVCRSRILLVVFSFCFLCFSLTTRASIRSVDNLVTNYVYVHPYDSLYLKEDADCTNVPGTNNCRAKLDLYGFNSTDEEAANTSATGLDQRQSGDCDSDTDCVWLQFTGSYHFSETQFKDGEWTMTLRNEKVNDLEVESLIIRLIYK